MFSLVYHKSVVKDLKKLDKRVAKNIFNSISSELAENLYGGERLHGELKQFYKFPVHVKATAFRVIYEIIPIEKTVWIIFIGPRENIYSRLLRRL